MATSKKKKPGDMLYDMFSRSMEVMADLTQATAAASMDKSLASARHLVKFQKTCTKAGLSLVRKVQDYTEKTLREAVKKGDWMPEEGKDVVDDWSKMMRSGIDEFSRVIDKSFDLLLKFLERAQKKAQTKTKRSPKKTAAKKSPAKKKTTAKKKSSAKKKTTAKKKTAAKKKSSS